MSLEMIITHYRNHLAALPDAILIGEIPEGAKNIPPEVLQLISPAHCAFLKLCKVALLAISFCGVQRNY